MKTYTQAEAKKKVISILVRLEKRFADKQVEGTRSVPSAPNTSVFRATQSGFIRTTSHHRSTGYAGMQHRREFALQVGALVTREDKAAIKKALVYAMKRAFGDRLTYTEGDRWNDPRFLVECDGPISENKVVVAQDFGTNYSTWFLA